MFYRERERELKKVIRSVICYCVFKNKPIKIYSFIHHGRAAQKAAVAEAAAETALSSGPAVGQQCHENIREKLLLLKEK